MVFFYFPNPRFFRSEALTRKEKRNGTKLFDGIPRHNRYTGIHDNLDHH